MAVLFTIQDKIATISINRPESYNSVTAEVAEGIQQALATCKEEEGVRVIVLTGMGKAFCAGQDLKEVTGDNPLTIEKAVTEHFNPMVMALREIEKPVIAAVNGVAAGAGANLALACDFVIATESAKFIQAFSKIGLIPDTGGTFFLPRLVGLPRATSLIMLGEPLGSEEAEAIGLIYKSAPDATFQEEVKALADKLSNMPTRALGLSKKALNYSLEKDLEKQLAIECQLQDTASQTLDYQEGVKAFLEKRAPKFIGK